MFFLLMGASGGGKSVALRMLEIAQPHIAWHDFDDIGVPAHASKAWRHQALEQWLKKALEYQSQGQDMGLCGQAPFGELLASPLASQLNGIAGCLLDCGDVVRIDRLRGRNAHDRGISQEMLNWAAWHRMHVTDPQWRQDVLREKGASVMCWERWEQWQRGDPRWNVLTLDTTLLSIEEVGQRLSTWITEQQHLTASGLAPLQGRWWGEKVATLGEKE